MNSMNIDDNRNAYANKVNALAILYPVSRGVRFMETAVDDALTAWHCASGDDAVEAWETYEILRYLLSEARRNGHR